MVNLNDLEVLIDFVYDAIKLGFKPFEIHVVYYFDDYRNYPKNTSVSKEVYKNNIQCHSNGLKVLIQYEDNQLEYRPKGPIWVLFKDKVAQFRKSGEKFNKEEIGKVGQELNDFLPNISWHDA